MQPQRNAAPQSLWPTLDSLDEAVSQIANHLPITNRHELAAALGLYHNTLLEVQKHERKQPEPFH